MIFNNPKTLVRVGRYDKSLEDAVVCSSVELSRFSFGLGNTVKYGTFNEKEQYLLIVSQQKDKILTLPTGYNVILTVTSYYDAKNKEVSDRFEKETGIDLSLDTPEILRKIMQEITVSFKAFEKNPKMASAVLKGE